ncbi:MAG: hypothetical protein IJQ22_09870, partial [Bacteroidales bacterium]|nr:hypothetical protein [Bacteroidales bacterium]
MKNRISAGAGILLALLLCLSGISVRAAWSDFGLPESGQGSVSLTLAYEKDDAGQRSRVAVAGADNENILQGVFEAQETGFAEPILIGSFRKIKAT